MLSLPIECAYMRAYTLGSERGERIKELGSLEALGALEALENLGSLENLENLPRGRIGTIEEMQNAKCKMQNYKIIKRIPKRGNRRRLSYFFAKRGDKSAA